MNMLHICRKYNEYAYFDCIYPKMTGCLVHTFGGEIPRVPGAAIKNTCFVVCLLLSLQFQLFTASFPMISTLDRVTQHVNSTGKSASNYLTRSRRSSAFCLPTILSTNIWSC